MVSNLKEADAFEDGRLILKLNLYQSPSVQIKNGALMSKLSTKRTFGRVATQVAKPSTNIRDTFQPIKTVLQISRQYPCPSHSLYSSIAIFSEYLLALPIARQLPRRPLPVRIRRRLGVVIRC
jgi:hypothetical protein